MGRHASQESIKVVSSFRPASRATESTLYNGAAAGATTGIDTKGYKEALIVMDVGAVASGGSLAVTVWSDDVDDSSGTLTQVASATMTIADTEDNNIFVGKIDLAGLAGRYLWIKTVQTGAVAIVYGAQVLLSEYIAEPVSQTNTVEFTV